jgi:enoyl-CoA hydratase/carnithine racemase
MSGSGGDGCLSYFLPRVTGHRKALEMALFGERIQASEAKERGLINYVVPDERLEETETLVARLVNGPTVACGQIKKLMHASWQNSIAEQGDARGRALWQFRDALTRCARRAEGKESGSWRRTGFAHSRGIQSASPSLLG